MLFPLPPGPVAPAADVIHGWRVTSYFGGRRHPVYGTVGTHGGMDLAYPGCSGQPIYAPVDGLLNQMWDPGGGGNWTNLWADDGSRWGFGHASIFHDPDGPGPLRNRNGQRVRAGEVIAYVGTTGGSTGPHLHLAYAPPPGRAYADPLDLLLASVTDQKDWFDMATKEELAALLDERNEKLAARLEGHTSRLAYGIDAENDAQADARLETFAARLEAHTNRLDIQDEGRKQEVLAGLLRAMTILMKVDRSAAEAIAEALGVELPPMDVNAP